MKDFFRQLAGRMAYLMGTPWAFLAAVLLIAVWGVTGPIFSYSDTWQLVINTGTTIITFLMVFLIQNAENRNSESLQLKLDELLRAVKGARTGLVDLEDLSEEELQSLHDQFQEMADDDAGSGDQGVPDGDEEEVPGDPPMDGASR